MTHKPVPPTIIHRMRLALDMTLEQGALLLGMSAGQLNDIEHYHDHSQHTVLAAIYYGFAYARGEESRLRALAKEAGIFSYGST